MVFVMENKEKNNMIKQTVLLSLISAFVAVLSFGKETVIAYYFGTSSSVDAYTVAAELPIVLFSIISVALSSVVIPMYLRIKESEGESSASEYVSKLIIVLMGLSVGSLILFEMLGDSVMKILAPGLQSDVSQLTTRLFRLILPATMLTLLVNVNNGISNGNKSFLLPALTPVFLNLQIIALTIFLSKQTGIYAVVIGTLLGVIIEVIYSSIIVKKFFHFSRINNFWDKRVAATLKLAVPTLVGTGMEEINKIVDRFFSSMLQTGSISVLYYGAKLSSGIYSLIIVSISTVSFSEIANVSAKNDKKKLGEVFSFSCRIILLIMIPIIIGGIVLKEEIITLIYKRGVFTIQDVKLVAPVFAIYLLSLFFSAMQVACRNYFYAVGDTKKTALASICCVLINIPLDAILSSKYGVYGLAMATTISTATASIMLIILIIKQRLAIDYLYNLIFTGKVFIGAVSMAIILLLMRTLCSQFLGNTLFTLCAIAVGALVYFIMLFLFGVSEISVVVQRINRRR